jgi:hypothetical protein
MTRRIDKVVTVGLALLCSAFLFPYVVFFGAMQEWVVETAARVGTPMTHYGEIAIVLFVVIWLIGAAVGGWWIFAPARRVPEDQSK